MSPISEPTSASASNEVGASIVALELAHYEDWRRLWKGYQAFYKVDIPETTTNLTWERLLDTGQPVMGALALRDGRVVGMVHWIFHRSTWTTGDYCYLQDLFVDTEVRGTGTGRRLIEHVYDQARQAKASRVYWLTHESNTDAMLLYDRIADKSGFIQYRLTL